MKVSSLIIANKRVAYVVRYVLRWRPNQQSAFTKRHSSNSKRPEPEDKKFFGALIKPKVIIIIILLFVIIRMRMK